MSRVIQREITETMISSARCAAALLCALSLVATAPLAEAGKRSEPKDLQILGWVENAFLVEPGFELKAKLDTGALTSSLDARIIKRFRQYGRRWVRFAVTDPDTGAEHVLVRERARTIGIVQHEGDNQTRPTVMMDVCIAGIERTIEVSLVNRENFTYPLLLGRRTLKHIAVVHPGATFLSDSRCLEPPDTRDVQGRAPSRTETADEELETGDGPPDEVVNEQTDELVNGGGAGDEG